MCVSLAFQAPRKELWDNHSRGVTVHVGFPCLLSRAFLPGKGRLQPEKQHHQLP